MGKIKKLIFTLFIIITFLATFSLNATAQISKNKEKHNNINNVDFLKKLNGKQADPAKLFKNSTFTNRLKKLTGSRYEFLEEIWNVYEPIKIKDNIFTAKACQIHNCGTTNAIIVVNFSKNIISVGIREEGKTENFSEDGLLWQEVIDWMRDD